MFSKPVNVRGNMNGIAGLWMAVAGPRRLGVVTAVFTTEQEWSSRKRSDTLGWGAAVSCCSGVSLTTEGGIESLKVQA